MRQPSKRILSVKDAAEYLSISRSYLYSLIKHEKIPSFKIGKRRVLDIEDLDIFVDTLKSN